MIGALPLAISILGTVLVVIGDYFLKRAGESGFHAGFFVTGTVFYALCAFCWYYAFKHMKVATIAGLYGVLTVLLLTAVAVFVFHEKLTAWELGGLGLALVSIVLLSRFG